MNNAEKGKRPDEVGGPSAKEEQNHTNGRGHSVVVLARGDVLAMEHGKAVHRGEGPELGGSSEANEPNVNMGEGTGECR